MKVAVSSQGPDLSSALDPRFGRAPYFILVDLDTDHTLAIENLLGAAAIQGSGIGAARTVVSLGAKALITGHCGPKAFAALRATGVDIYAGAEGTVREALEGFKRGALVRAQMADVGAHW